MPSVEQLEIFLEQYKQQITEEAKNLLYASMPQVTQQNWELYEQTGNRIQFENVYYARRKFLATFGMKALLEQEERGAVQKLTMNKLTDIIEDICQEECWAIAAHVNHKSDDWHETVDLFASETAQTLSELADRLRTELPQGTYKQVVQNVERRIFTPYFCTDIGSYGWENSDHNWNAVITGSIGSACLHLMKDRTQELNQCIDRVCSSLPYYVGGFAEDGTCMEGLDYFTYGMTYFVNFTQELYDYTTGEKDLLRGNWDTFQGGAQDKRVRMAQFQNKCFFPDGRTVSFSDGSSHSRFRVGLSCALARRFDFEEMPNMDQAGNPFDDTCYRFAALKMDYYETKKQIAYLRHKEIISDAEPSNAAQFHFLPDAQWCIASAANGVGMACKGGHNGEPHNHNDVGSFIYEAQGIFFLTDLGAGEYTKEYFKEGRYGILCNHSKGHNLPIIGGKGQCTGAEHRCHRFQSSIVSLCEKSQASEMEDQAIITQENRIAMIHMELAGAYDEELLGEFHRCLSFNRGTGSLTIEDKFTLPVGNNQSVVENLVTQIPPKIKNHEVHLQKNGVTAILTIIEMDPTSRVIIREYDHSNHQGQPEKVYAIQWEIPVVDGKASSRYQMKLQP